jgi:formylglycine-generating enzyme required for sulfatase activity
MADELKTQIANDSATDVDALDFAPYADTLAEIAQTASTPITVGVFGSWGSGKTSLMMMVKKTLGTQPMICSWFDAWKYDKEETLWRAFLLSVLEDIKHDVLQHNAAADVEAIEKAKSLLYQSLDIEKAGGVTIDLSKLGGDVAKGLIQIGLSFIPSVATLTDIAEKLSEKGTENATDKISEAITRERSKVHIEQVRSLEQFQDKFKIVIDTYVTKRGKRLVVFVDDLDRCLPEKAIEVLEAIKLFFDLRDCVFMLGLDEHVIARGVEIRYKEFEKKDDGEGGANPISGAEYLEKIIQLPFAIPQIDSGKMQDFVLGLADWTSKKACANVFAKGLGDNPRKIKRTVNTFMMLWTLTEKRKLSDIKPVRLAKMVAIQNIAPRFYELLKRNHILLKDVEEFYNTAEVKADAGEDRAGLAMKASRPEAPAMQLPDDLIRLLNKTPAVKNILKRSPNADENFKDIPYAELEAYFTLTRRAEAPAEKNPEVITLPFEPQMIRIPAGKFIMGTSDKAGEEAIKAGASENWVEYQKPQHEVELSEYSIGKYPITNQQYQAYVREGGKAPQGWDGDQFPQGKDSHPVVNVSWDDAQAFCAWISKKTNKPYALPTEAQWEKAARGADGRIWSWGNEFDKTKANTAEAGIGDTTPVGQFSPQGDSPYGCADMIGNVWEWCQDRWDENEYKKRKGKVAKDPQGAETGEVRALRGGAFDYISFRNARCADRLWSSSYGFDLIIGFRLVLSPSSKSDL